MTLLTKDELRNLADYRDESSVSLFMPTHRAGPEVQQDKIRLKNLLAQAKVQLQELGLGSAESDRLLAEGTRLLHNSHFWRHQSDGLALYINRESTRSLCLPLPFAEKVLISDRFHLKPLLPLLSNDGQFLLLALSQNDTRLLQGTRYNFEQVDLGDVPRSLAEALPEYDPERELQWHTGAPRIGGERAAMFHGHGGAESDAKEKILRFFHRLDAGLAPLLAEERAPMVLAAVDYLLPIFRSASSYAHVLEDAVEGNPDELSAARLHQKGWAVVEPLFRRQQEEAANRFYSLAGSALASTGLESVAPAALHGRVEALFVARFEQCWGVISADGQEVEVHASYQPGDGDLLDFAAIHTFLNGGTVFVVERDQVPGEAPIAAVYRY